MVERGTYSEFLKSGIDIFSLFEKGNEQSEPSSVPGTPSLTSESLVQSFKSPRPSLKDAAQEDQEVSFSSCNTPGSVCSWWSHGPSSALLMTSSLVPKQNSKQAFSLPALLTLPIPWNKTLGTLGSTLEQMKMS